MYQRYVRFFRFQVQEGKSSEKQDFTALFVTYSGRTKTGHDLAVISLCCCILIHNISML